jgi:uncharacterized protein
VVSNPWNLEVSSIALQNTYLGREVYLRVMGGNMKRLLEKHTAQIAKNSKVNLEEAMKVKYLHEFDRVVQGPTWGYPTEGAYYRDASSTDSIFAIKVYELAYIPLFILLLTITDTLSCDQCRR